MKRALLKTAFVLAVLLFGMILMIPVQFVIDGYRGDRLPLGVIGLGVCFAIADRSISSLFRLANFTEERWSVFRSRARR